MSSISQANCNCWSNILLRVATWSLAYTAVDPRCRLTRLSIESILLKVRHGRLTLFEEKNDGIAITSQPGCPLVPATKSDNARYDITPAKPTSPPNATASASGPTATD